MAAWGQDKEVFDFMNLVYTDDQLAESGAKSFEVKHKIWSNKINKNTARV